ncbi:MAG: type II toxin-antitoxin system RelE family toxin [Minisyncoccales bacterium]
MKYKVYYTKQAIKDIQSLTPKLKEKARQIINNVIAKDPSKGKRLLGDLEGNYSIRLNLKDRIVYSFDKKNKNIFIKRAHTHYGE